MDYQKIMCEFCKNCTGIKINKQVINSESIVNGDTVVTRCDNFIPKLNFKSSTKKCCSFFVGDENNEQIEN